MPRGQKRPTTPEWARQDNERLILETLEKYPDGLRFADLRELLRDRLSKQTLSTRLKSFQGDGMVSYNKSLKRYSIAEQGFSDLRRLNIFRIMMRAGHVEQWVFGDALTKRSGYPSFFISYQTDRKSARYGLGNQVLRKKCFLFRESWLYYIFSLARAEGLRIEENFPKTSNRQIEKIWRRLFPTPQSMLFVEYVDTEAMLEWLKTDAGKNAVNNALAEFSAHASSVEDIL